MGFMGQRLKTEKYFFLENGWTDFNEKNINIKYVMGFISAML